MPAVLTAFAQAPDSAALAYRLLRHAAPGHPDAAFFATVIGKSLAHGDLARSGLAPDELEEVLTQLFPGARRSPEPALVDLPARLAAYAAQGLPDPRPDFTLLLRTLLDAYGAPQCATTPFVTRVLVHACLRPDHLWRDLGLTGREDVTALLTRHYPRLVARNTRNLRWKQFLAYSACEHAGLPAAAAPGCAACEDHDVCYGDGGAD